MGHAHHHHDESLKNYFTEQLLTILVCGVFGFTAIQLYREDRLATLIAPDFYPWVLGGGIAILVMVVLRSIVVWKEAGQYQANGDYTQGGDCALDHVHGQDCNHVNIPGQDDDHDHSDHNHNNDMSWFFARMLILAFPLFLFFMGLPNSSLSAEGQLNRLGNETAFGMESLKDMIKGATVLDEKKSDDGTVTKTLKTRTGLTVRETTSPNREVKLDLIGGPPIGVKFNELNEASYDAGKRETLQGNVAVLEGRFKRVADKEFTLFRMKMTCCMADAVPLKVRIFVPQALSGFTDGEWVQLKGQIQFLEAPNKSSYLPVLMVADINDIKKKTAPAIETE